MNFYAPDRPIEKTKQNKNGGVWSNTDCVRKNYTIWFELLQKMYKQLDHRNLDIIAKLYWLSVAF